MEMGLSELSTADWSNASRFLAQTDEIRGDGQGAPALSGTDFMSPIIRDESGPRISGDQTGGFLKRIKEAIEIGRRGRTAGPYLAFENSRPFLKG